MFQNFLASATLGLCIFMTDAICNDRPTEGDGDDNDFRYMEVLRNYVVLLRNYRKQVLGYDCVVILEQER